MHLSIYTQHFRLPLIFRIPRSLFPSSAAQHLFNSNQTHAMIFCACGLGTFFHPLPHPPQIPTTSSPTFSRGQYRLGCPFIRDTAAGQVSRGNPSLRRPPLVDFSKAKVIASTSCIYHSNKLNAFSRGDVIPLVRLLFFLHTFYYYIWSPNTPYGQYYDGVLQFLKRRH